MGAVSSRLLKLSRRVREREGAFARRIDLGVEAQPGLAHDGSSDVVRSAKLGIDPSAPVITTVYEFDEVLGRGAFGEVHRARHIESGRLYAIKKLRVSSLCTANRTARLRNEVRVLTGCRHPNIIRLREVFGTDEYVYLVMELARGGELMDVVIRDGLLTEALAVKVRGPSTLCTATAHTPDDLLHGRASGDPAGGGRARIHALSWRRSPRHEAGEPVRPRHPWRAPGSVLRHCPLKSLQPVRGGLSARRVVQGARGC
jgi:hypothetical protein